MGGMGCGDHEFEKMSIVFVNNNNNNNSNISTSTNYVGDKRANEMPCGHPRRENRQENEKKIDMQMSKYIQPKERVFFLVESSFIFF
jgi:hypothetical protein